MNRLTILITFFALSAGQVLQVPSSFKNGVKWEFGTDVSRGDVSGRSNVNIVSQAPIVPTVYKKELITAPIARRDPIAVYDKSSAVRNVYKKPIVPTVYKQKPVVQSVHQQQSIIPAVFKTHPVASNIYKSQPVVHNVYKQQTAVPIVQAMSNVYRFKSQPVQPVVHYHEPTPLQDYVPKVVIPVNLQKKVTSHAWNYPHTVVHGDVQFPHN